MRRQARSAPTGPRTRPRNGTIDTRHRPKMPRARRLYSSVWGETDSVGSLRRARRGVSGPLQEEQAVAVGGLWVLQAGQRMEASGWGRRSFTSDHNSPVRARSSALFTATVRV